MDRMEVKIDEVQHPVYTFNPNVLIIIVGLPFVDGKEAPERVKALLSDGLPCEPVPEVVNAERMVPKGRGRGIIRVEFRSLQDKVAVLRRKRSLRENKEFQRVYIHNAKSHTERLMDVNLRTLLKEFPWGKDYFLTGSGQLTRRVQAEPEGSDRSPRGRERRDIPGK